MTAAAPIRSSRRGYLLMETLISLSITAGLLVAMASAFVAASSVVQMNDTFFRSIQQARTGMDLAMTEVRRCQSVSSASTTSVTLTPDATDFSGHSITIAYQTTGTYAHEITLTDNVTGSVMPLATNVASATFGSLSGLNLGGSTVVAAVSLTMTIQIGGSQMTLSDSAAPRADLVSLYQ
jgi:type II secretory pathway pseudopilin PulG